MTLDAPMATLALPPTLPLLHTITSLVGVLALTACASGTIGEAAPTDADTADKPDTIVTDNNSADPDVSPDTPDDDADTGPSGSVNNGVVVSCLADETRFCTTPCGTQGISRCEGTAFGPCIPPEEDCDGVDQDCDGEIDEGVGQRACSSSCGGGSESCTGGVWSGCTAADPRAETCNGQDDDCDSRIDEDLTRGCTTPCGNGTETCVRGEWIGCTAQTPLPETCDGEDNDCNGGVDDGVVRSCATACASGIETCRQGRWGTCDAPAPQAEVCDRDDNDCDGTVDEDLSRACSTACGSGTESCSRGQWLNCNAPQPRMETCNGQDDDCDGQVDNNLSRTCSTACGSGTEACSMGQWRGCTAPQPQMESCNNLDDDCDGQIDEGLQVQPMAANASALTNAQSACDPENPGIDVCLTAAHRWCRSTQGCFATGVGPVDFSWFSGTVGCLGSSVTVVNTTESAVSAASGISLFELEHTRLAWSASNRYCRTLGYGGGIGPVEHSLTAFTISCVPASIGSTVEFPASQLAALGCDLDNIESPTCASAAHRVCQNAGWEFGHGPVEWNLTVMHVLCLRD